MRRRRFLLAVIAPATAGLAAVTSACASTQSPIAAAAEEITVSREEWRDPARNRVVPVKLYIPAGRGPFPVVIHSHGLGQRGRSA